MKIQMKINGCGGVNGDGGHGVTAEFDLKLGPVWGAKIIENLKENQWLGVNGADGQRVTAEIRLKWGLCMEYENH